ncbi:Nodule Cysteine-Rich (NCR) secreted peptide [Medicago truncatula]|uniref:Nodule Cysteine-Rich (NCR) secreted peptide n=1 Tax=Medicago truncatula TaxID=3880 RepID=A0A072TFE5_MEDTR|nr:Nodule Cysteine-Rich (NCR) secreted peptide [Medicago truncatula]
MVKVIKFVYITIYFLSLFFIAKNDATAIHECRAHSHCVARINCVLPRKPQCRNYACGCYDSNKYR